MKIDLLTSRRVLQVLGGGSYHYSRMSRLSNLTMGLRQPQVVSARHGLASAQRHRRLAPKQKGEWYEPPRSIVIELPTPVRLDFSCQL